MSDFDQINGQTNTDVFSDTDFSVPPDYKVIFFNDDFTTMDFVVDVLVHIFHKSEREAVELMEKVHTSGSAIVGTYTYDIAATRVTVTRQQARKAGFPLRVELEIS